MRLRITTRLTRRRVLTRNTDRNKETDVKTPVPKRMVLAAAAMPIHRGDMDMKNGIGLVRPSANTAVCAVLNIAIIVLLRSPCKISVLCIIA